MKRIIVSFRNGKFVNIEGDMIVYDMGRFWIYNNKLLVGAFHEGLVESIHRSEKTDKEQMQ